MPKSPKHRGHFGVGGKFSAPRLCETFEDIGEVVWIYVFGRTFIRLRTVHGVRRIL